MTNLFDHLQLRLTDATDEVGRTKGFTSTRP